MRSILEKGIEMLIKQAAKDKMSAAEYNNFVNNLRRTKITHGGGHRSLYVQIADEATKIADFATGGGYSAVSDEVEKLKNQAANRIKSMLGL